MTDKQNVTTDVTRLLAAVGGELLMGSGFEDESPERGFGEGELSADEMGTARSE